MSDARAMTLGALLGGVVVAGATAVAVRQLPPALEAAHVVAAVYTLAVLGGAVAAALVGVTLWGSETHAEETDESSPGLPHPG
ncbi:MAG: hypothetical protein ACRC1K_18490 [Planctomycetia bacterium]